MGQNLTNLPISSSFQRLLQIDGTTVSNGVGDDINILAVTSSLAFDSITTASAVATTITFTKGDGSTFDVTVAQSGSVESASYAENAGNASSASYIEASNIDGIINSASHAETADLALVANSALSAITATTASHALQADNALLATTASLATGNLYTASAAANVITFEKGDGSTFDVIIAQSGSVESASYADVAELAYTASYVAGGDVAGTVASSLLADSASYVAGSNVDGLVVSASHALVADVALNVPDTASYALFAESSSYAVSADSSISSSHALIADLATTASYVAGADVDGAVGSASDAEKVTFAVQNNTAGTLPKGTPIHITSTTGGTSLVIAASASVAGAMPSHGILNSQLTAGQDGEATIIGQVTGLNTIGITAGDTIYVGINGGFTNVKPTAATNLIQNLGVVKVIDASNGIAEIFGSGRSNDLPNLQEDFVWVGNSSGVPVAVDQSTLSVGSAVTASHALDLDSNGNYTVNQISASSATFASASIGFLESITGSAKIIGDAFIILNADTPTQRYAGIKVYDSGSTPIASSSLVWDGQTDDWKYEYSASGTHESAVVMFGPESDDLGITIYPTTNAILKSVGGHHMSGSILSDDGSTVTADGDITANVITANTNFAGDLIGTADSASYINGSNVDGDVATAVSASHALQADVAISSSHALNTDVAISSSHALNADNSISSSYVAAADVDGTVATATSASHALNADTATSSSHALNADVAISSSHAVSADSSISSSYVAAADVDGTVATAISASHALFADEAFTSLSALSALSASYAPLDTSLDNSWTGDQLYSGSVRGQVNALSIVSNTASLDLSLGNFNTINLISGSDTFINPSNIKAGQTINIKIQQASPGNGTVSFPNSVKQVTGSAYIPSEGAGPVDIVTLVSFDNSFLYLANVQNLV